MIEHVIEIRYRHADDPAGSEPYITEEPTNGAARRRIAYLDARGALIVRVTRIAREVVPAAEYRPPTVHILTWDHRHGTNVTAHVSEAVAADAMHDTMREHWPEGVPRPDGDHEAMENLWAEHGDGTFSIVSAEVQS